MHYWLDASKSSKESERLDIIVTFSKKCTSSGIRDFEAMEMVSKNSQSNSIDLSDIEQIEVAL